MGLWDWLRRALLLDGTPKPDPLITYVNQPVGGDADPQPQRVATPSRGRVTPPGPEYEHKHFPPPFASPCDFVKFCREMLARMGLTGLPADLLIAHLGRECGFGKNVYCYNFGNKRVFAGQNVPWYRHTDGLPYRAFMSSFEGLRAMVETISTSHRYAKAWQMLQAGDAKWYSELGIAGYYQTHDPVTHAIVDVTAANVGPCQRDYEEHQLATVKRCLIT